MAPVCAVAKPGASACSCPPRPPPPTNLPKMLSRVTRRLPHRQVWAGLGVTSMWGVSESLGNRNCYPRNLLPGQRPGSPSHSDVGAARTQSEELLSCAHNSGGPTPHTNHKWLPEAGRHPGRPSWPPCPTQLAAPGVEVGVCAGRTLCSRGSPQPPTCPRPALGLVFVQRSSWQAGAEDRESRRRRPSPARRSPCSAPLRREPELRRNSPGEAALTPPDHTAGDTQNRQQSLLGRRGVGAGGPALLAPAERGAGE